MLRNTPLAQQQRHSEIKLLLQHNTEHHHVNADDAEAGKALGINTPFKRSMGMTAGFNCRSEASNGPNNMTALIESSLAVDHDREAAGSGWQLPKWRRLTGRFRNTSAYHKVREGSKEPLHIAGQRNLTYRNTLKHSSKGPQFYPRSLVFYITPDGTITDTATLIRAHGSCGGLNYDAVRFERWPRPRVGSRRAQIGYHSPEYTLAPALGFTTAHCPTGTLIHRISATASPWHCLQPH